MKFEVIGEWKEKSGFVKTMYRSFKTEFEALEEIDRQNLVIIDKCYDENQYGFQFVSYWCEYQQDERDEW